VTIASEPAPAGRCPDTAGQVEIILAEGERIIVWADIETAALSRVLKALSRRFSGSERRQGLDRDGSYRHAAWHAGLALQVQEILNRDPHAGDLYIFRGRRGDLAKILCHDGIGLSLYAKRLDRGTFIWPSASGGAVSISAAQMAYMLEGIDWRNPQLTWRPKSAG